jgi:hypothetical protein
MHIKQKVGIIFFLFIAIFLIPSCKKKDSLVGKNTINQDDLLNATVIDTFSLNTYTIWEDSVITSTSSVALLGNYEDPIFGSVEAGFYTQLRLPSTNPNFGDLSTIEVDSFVLGLKYTEVYGSLEDQTFEVYELDDTMAITSIYYSFDSKSIKSTNLMDPNRSTLTPDPFSDIKIDTSTYDPQLRLYIDTNLAKQFMAEANNNTGSFDSNDAFANYFKGLYVKSASNFSSGQGAVFSFDINDPVSKLTIYYRQAGVRKTFDFLINSSAAKFNKVTIDNSGTTVESVVNNPSTGNDFFYTQALASRAVVEIPGLENLGKNIIIHEATLELPVVYQTGDNYGPGQDLNFATNMETTSKLFSVGAGYYDATTNYFKVDLKTYIQAKITKQKYPVTINGVELDLLIDGSKIYIYPKQFNSSVYRIKFYGSNSTSYKPKLTLKYTEF